MNERVCLYVSPYKSTSSYFEMIDLAAENGIKYLEPINQYELTNPDMRTAQKIKRYADSKGIIINCFSLCINLVGEGAKENIKRAKDYVDIAALFGAKIFHHTIANEYRNPEIIEKNKDKYFNEGLEAVREIYDYAIKKGIRTAHEDQGYLFNGIDNFKKFIMAVNRNTGVIADIGNIKFVNEDIDPFFDEFKDRIVNIHIKDYAECKEQDNGYKTKNGNYICDCELQKGTVDFDSAFAKISKTGYDGTFSLESPPSRNVNERNAFTHNLVVMKKYIDKLSKE